MIIFTTEDVKYMLQLLKILKIDITKIHFLNHNYQVMCYNQETQNYPHFHHFEVI